MSLQITPSARVIASHVRYPLRIQDRTLYELITEHGRYFSAAAPEVIDASGAPITLAAELALGSLVRVAVLDGLLHTVQVIEARFFNPFSAEAPP
jgi:hypothetical protein